MPELPPRSRLLAELRAHLEEQLASLKRAQKSSQEGATHEETRAEDPKDMRSTEASYLARGLAERVGQLREAVATLSAFEPPDDATFACVQAGALVGVENEDGDVAVHLFVPAGGGVTLDAAASGVHSLSASSPLGAELLGRSPEEEVEVDLPGGRQLLYIAWVR